MKKACETPTAEKLEFQYEKAVVAYSGICSNEWTVQQSGTCQDKEIVKSMHDA